MLVTFHELRDGQEHEEAEKKSPHVLVATDGKEYPLVVPIVEVPFQRPGIHCQVTIAGKKAQLSDLAQGMECELTLTDDGKFVRGISV